MANNPTSRTTATFQVFPYYHRPTTSDGSAIPYWVSPGLGLSNELTIVTNKARYHIANNPTSRTTATFQVFPVYHRPTTSDGSAIPYWVSPRLGLSNDLTIVTNKSRCHIAYNPTSHVNGYFSCFPSLPSSNDIRWVRHSLLSLS